MPGERESHEPLILDAAIALLATHGERALTLATVARHAGTSKSLVLYHFGTRKRLVDAVAERLLAETDAGLARLGADYPRPRARLDALLDTLFEEPPELDRASVRNMLAFWLEHPLNAERLRLVHDFTRRTLDEVAGRTGGARGARVRDGAAQLIVADWAGTHAVWAGGGPVDFALARHAAGERVEAALAAGGRRR